MSLSEVLNKAFEKGETPKKERSTVKETRGKISEAVRSEIIRFLRTRTDITTKVGRLQAAIEAHAKGILSPKTHESGAAVKRWYAYIGNPAYDPDAAAASPGALAKVARNKAKKKGIAPQFLATNEQRDAVALFMQTHMKEYERQTDCMAAACKHVGVSITPNSHNASIYFNRKVAKPAPVVELSPVRNGDHKPVGKTSKEDRNRLAVFMAENEDKYERQVDAMEAAIAKFGLNIKANIGNASVYMRKGKEILDSRPKEVYTVTILGSIYTMEQLEEMVKAQRNALKPLKACPECAYPLALHAQAYTVAKRHHTPIEE